jgi:hypothetical protein
MRLMIRNFGSLERADVTLSNKITLIAGRNGAGKSTTARALAMLLAGVTIPEGLLKKNSADIVRDGQAAGSIALMIGEGQSISIAYPSAQRATTGSELPYASHIAAGLTSWESLKSDERARLLADLLKTAPTEADLAAVLADSGLNAEEAAAVWKEIGSIGWALAEKSYKENGTKAKGAWERVTGERFGSSKAAMWRPANWTPDLMDATKSGLEAAVKRAETERDKAVAGAAVDSAKLEELRAKAAGLADAQTAVADARAAVEVAEGELKKAEAARQALPLIDTGNSVPCPHCNGALLADVHHRTKALRLAKAEVLPEAEIKKQQMAQASADGTVENRNDALNLARRSLAAAEARQKEAESAAHELAQVSSRTGSMDAITTATDALRAAQARFKAWNDANAAKEEYQKWARADAIATALSDTGVRKTKLERVLSMFADSWLAPLCDGAKWARVEIGPDLTPTYGGRAWPLLSESERYRVEVILRIAIAKLDGSSLVIIDRADVLDQGNRNGLLGMLSRLEDLPAVVCMTARREAVPDLSALGKGASYWIEGGTAAPITAQAQAA